MHIPQVNIQGSQRTDQAEKNKTQNKADEYYMEETGRQLNMQVKEYGTECDSLPSMPQTRAQRK